MASPSSSREAEARQFLKHGLVWAAGWGYAAAALIAQPALAQVAGADAPVPEVAPLPDTAPDTAPEPAPEPQPVPSNLDDLIRRAVIMALMCQGRVEFEAVEMAHLVDPQEYFADEIERLAPFQEEGLVEVDAQGIELTPLGWFFVRGVAMVFDRYLQTDRDRARFSRII